MRKDKFITSGLAGISRHKKVAEFLAKSSSNDVHHENMKKLLSMSYDKYVRDYYATRKFLIFLIYSLRLLGLAADGIGTYVFWKMGGIGFGIKAIGLVLKSIADVIDFRLVFEHKKNLAKDNLKVPIWKIVLEGVIARAAAYTPYGIGELIDFLRGRGKFSRKIDSAAIKQARKAFMLNTAGIKERTSFNSQAVKRS